jgi:histidine ammonia-lyase
MMLPPILIGSELRQSDLFDDLIRVAREGRQVHLAPKGRERIASAYRLVQQWSAEGRAIYGMTTAVGDNIRSLIPPSEATRHSTHLIRTHASGTGPNLSDEIVRAIMYLRLQCFAMGHSGISPGVVDTLIQMLNFGLSPCIPEQGSVGASGDLAPLAHVGLGVIGEGCICVDGKVMQAGDAFRKAGISPVKELTLKDGLSLINGTSAMTALGAILCYDTQILLDSALVAAAMSIEALGGLATPNGKEGNDLRPHPGATAIAARLFQLLTSGGSLISSEDHLANTLRSELDSFDVRQASQHRQHVYTMRCNPAILGAVQTTLTHVRSVVEVEMMSVDDNPLVLNSGEPFHGSHFHGQHVAMVMDFLANALCVLGIAAERRAARLLDRTKNEGLPPFLTVGVPGLDYGFQGPQFTCTALVAESRTLCYPASVGSISTNADFQDVVSMGFIAARKAQQIYRNILRVVGFELICAAQAVELRMRDGGRPSRAATAALSAVRGAIPPMTEDRSVTDDFEAVARFIESGALLREVDAAM